MDIPPTGARNLKWAPPANIDDLNGGELVAKSLPLVHAMARRLRRHLPQQVELDDLISAGHLGLIEAAARFNPTAGIHFAVYARTRAKGAMLDYLRACDWSPREVRRKGRAREDAIQALAIDGNTSPSGNDIADKMGITLDGYQSLVNDLSAVQLGSLHVPYADDSGEQLIDRVTNSSIEDPLTQCLKLESKQRLTAALEALSEREQLILALIYHEELTTKDVAEVLGIAGSRVSQIHSAAIVKLKRILS